MKQKSVGLRKNNSFDRAKYEQAWHNLSDRSQLSLTPLHILPVIPSTNQYIWSLIEQKQQLPLAAIALQQTAGRGQWGKTWQSSLGGLYLSVGITTNLHSECYPHLIMATAWGIAHILRQHQVPVLLKWSNDLILLGKKLGGIKIETRTQQPDLTHAVIGVGINWTNAVPDLGINLQSYYQTQTEPNTARLRKVAGSGKQGKQGEQGSRGRRNYAYPNSMEAEAKIVCLEQLTAITIYGILSGYQHYVMVGIEQLRDDYLNLLSNLGQQITIEGCPGIVSGVTTKGELTVRLRSPGATTEICFAPGQISLGY